MLLLWNFILFVVSLLGYITVNNVSSPIFNGWALPLLIITIVMGALFVLSVVINIIKLIKK